jgi:hypothetical protein
LFLIVLVLTSFAAGSAVAQDWRRTGPPYPAYEPFSLNSYDVISAVLMIRREFALVRVDEAGHTSILPVHSVRSVWVDFDPDAFENHQNRYDILLNDEPLDWNHTYIEYGGDLVNLKILFTYNNQRPFADVDYRVDPR